MSVFLRADGEKRRSRRLMWAIAATIFLSPAMVADAYAAACSAAIATKAASRATWESIAAIAAGGTISGAFANVMGALTTYSQGTTNDGQNIQNAAVVLADREVAARSANAVAQVRVQNVAQFQPSRVTCSLVSGLHRTGLTAADYSNARKSMQQVSLKLGMNAPGTRSEKGSLANMTGLWKERCTKYADPTKLGALPEGESCPGPSDPALRDLDVRPWQAFIDPIVLTDPKRLQAAKDAVEMLTDVESRDALRGAALNRSVGQTAHVRVARDETRMNLARAVLQDAVALRTPSATAGGISRLAGLLEAVTGKKFDTASNSLSGEASVIAAAGDSDNGTNQNIGARLATQQALLFEVMRVSEMIMAVDSVELAIKLEQNKARMGAVSASVKPN